jgi:hypothetical protein
MYRENYLEETISKQPVISREDRRSVNDLETPKPPPKERPQNAC